MKKLLAILGSFVILSTSISSVTSCAFDNYSLKDSTNLNYKAPEEMYQISEKMNNILNGNKTVDTDNDLINLFTQSELMLKDTSSQEMFYKLSNEIGQMITKFSSQLQKLSYKNDKNVNSNALTVFRDYLNQQDQFFSQKLQTNTLDLWNKYNNLKLEESRLFFDKYDLKSTYLLEKVVSDQDQINKLNTENAGIQEQVKGLNTQNRIVSKIINVINESVNLCGKVKEIFDNLDNKIVSNYNKSVWHDNNWGLGFIPFAGIGFNMDFKKAMDNTTKFIQIYLDSFSGTNKEYSGNISDLEENLKAMKESLSQIDPENNDIVAMAIKEANFDTLTGAALEAAFGVLKDAIQKGLGPFGGILGTIINILGSGFNAYKLHNNFNTFSEKYQANFQKPLNKNLNYIHTAFATLNNDKTSFEKIFIGNNKKSNDLINQLNNNSNKINNLNKDLENTSEFKHKTDNNLTLLINQGMYCDFYYYWNASKIGSITNFKKTNLISINKDNVSNNIDDINKEKNDVYNNLISKIANLDLKQQLEYDNNQSNIMYKGIKNI